MKETSRHRDAFEQWYSLERNWTKSAQNSTVSRRLLYSWADTFNWLDRADKRDAMAQRIIDEEAAKERADRQKRRRMAGELLTARGLEYLREHPLETAADAIRAIKAGTEIERKEDGVPDWVLMILNADPSTLEAMGKTLGATLSGATEAGGILALPEI